MRQKEYFAEAIEIRRKKTLKDARQNGGEVSRPGTSSDEIEAPAETKGKTEPVRPPYFGTQRVLQP